MDRQRIDKWLWHARIVKTRSAAAGLVSGGRVRINGGRVVAPGHAVKIGDVVTSALDGRVCVWRVEQFIADRPVAMLKRDGRCTRTWRPATGPG